MRTQDDYAGRGLGVVADDVGEIEVKCHDDPEIGGRFRQNIVIRCACKAFLTGKLDVVIEPAKNTRDGIRHVSSSLRRTTRQ